MVELSARESAKNARLALLSLSLTLVGGAACSSDTPRVDEPPAAPAPDTTAPTLVSRTPEPDQVTVYTFAPISLTFSEALAEGSVNASAFELRADTETEPLKFEVHLAEDPRKVELVLVNAPRGPARVTLDVAATLTDVAGNAFAGTSWSWQLPVWFNAASPENTSAPPSLGVSLAVESDGGAVLVWEDNTSGSVLKAARLAATWTPLGEFLNQSQQDPAESPSVVSTSDGPVAAWLEGATNPNVFVKRWDGKTWTLLGPGAVNTLAAAGPVLSADDTGTLTVTWIENASRVHVARWTSMAWEALVEPFVSPTEIRQIDVVFQQGSLVLAVAHGSADSADLAVFSWDAAGRTWRQLGSPLDRQLADTVQNPSLASSPDGSLAVAWQESDGTSDHLYVSQYDPPSQTWKLLGSSLDLEIDDDATHPELAFQKMNEPLIAWRESRGPQAVSSYVMRWAQGRWQALGAFTSPHGLGERIALAVDERDNPSVVIQAGERLEVHRFNGTPDLPFGLLPRQGQSSCRLPDDEDPNFPGTLSATGCYADVAKRVPAAGAFPFDLNSPLWSDGAIKRRFVIPPDGKSLGYTSEGAWDVPPGTIFMKEFLFEREPGNRASVFPMETRLLIKRCEEGECLMPWQGYSFKWNSEGTDAALLENAVDEEFHDWPFANGTHRHTYPGRAQCTHCHLLAAGGTLGFQTAQLNRNFNYGGVVDNQLRALQHAGVLGAAEPRAFADAPRLPNPADVSFSLEARTRTYLHGNCAGCHRPGGSWPVVDYRYQVSLADSQMCQLITPGNAETSKLYLKDCARSSSDLPGWVTGEPMPPFATLLADQRQLSTMKSWIDGMKTCP